MAALSSDPDPAAGGVPEPKRKGGRRRLVLRSLKAAIAVVLLAVLVLRIGWQDIASSFASLAWWWIPGLVAVRLVGLFLQSLRWKLYLGSHGIEASPFRLFRYSWVSRFFSNFLPGQTGGDLSRVLYGWDETVKKSKLASSVIMDRVVGFLGLLLVAAVAGLTHLDLVEQVNLGLWPWAAAAGALVLTVLITMRAPTIWAQHLARLVPGAALRSKVAGVLRDLAVHNEHWDRLLGGVLLSAGFYVVAAVHTWLAFLAFGVHLDFVGVLVVVPLVTMIMAVPITVNGWGVAEAVKVVLYVQLGATGAEAFAVALLGRFTLTLIGATGGVIYLLTPGRRPANRERRGWLFGPGTT
jgi:hypothetical protein